MKKDEYLGTYENSKQNNFQSPVDDSELEEAFVCYLQTKEKILKRGFKSKEKGVIDLINEDNFLSKKVTYEEFEKIITNENSSDEREL